MELNEILVSLFDIHGTINLQMFDASIVKEGAEDRDKLYELREDQNLVTHSENFGHHTIEQLEFSS